MTTRYCYEYGKRWPKMLPRNDIRFLVNRLHVSMTESEVGDLIADRAERSGIPRRMLPACRRYAIEIHRRNRHLSFLNLNPTQAAKG